jgi:hypothetical protein
MMVNNGGIALYNPIHGEVASISSICDLTILEYFHSHFDSIDRTASIAKKQHCHLRSTKWFVLAKRRCKKLRPGLLVTGVKVYSFVLNAVIASASMHENATYVLPGRALGWLPG